MICRTLPHFAVKVDYGKLRHFCDDPVCPDPVWKLSIVCSTHRPPNGGSKKGGDPKTNQQHKLAFEWLERDLNAALGDFLVGAPFSDPPSGGR